MEAPATSLDLGDAARRLANMIRPGTVAETDLAAARARVRYGESPDGAPALTAWLPWLAPAAGEDRDWRPPSIGEQVVLLAPYGELAAAFVLPGAYRDKFPAPGDSGAKRATRYRDGAIIEYDSMSHALKAVLPDGGTASIAAPGGLSVTGDTEIAGDVTIAGAVTIDGSLTVTGDITSQGDISAPQGPVSDASGSMREMRGVFNKHKHLVVHGAIGPPIEKMK